MPRSPASRFSHYASSTYDVRLSAIAPCVYSLPLLDAGQRRLYSQHNSGQLEGFSWNGVRELQTNFCAQLIQLVWIGHATGGNERTEFLPDIKTRGA